MCLQHEGSVIEVQCQLVICREYIRIPKCIFQKKIVIDSFGGGEIINSSHKSNI